MTKMVEIEHCRHCPYFERYINNPNGCCFNLLYRKETNNDGIPDWCPLPEKENK